MRFHGQRHTIRNVIGSAVIEDEIRASFEATYERRYGFVEKNSPIEFVGLVVTAVVAMDRPVPAQLVLPKRSAATATRAVFFAERGARIATPVLQRGSLDVGFEGAGPAVIEEYGSTTVVGPDDRFTVGRFGELHIRFH
jgi:N-methylhydantoinase A